MTRYQTVIMNGNVQLPRSMEKEKGTEICFLQVRADDKNFEFVRDLGNYKNTIHNRKKTKDTSANPQGEPDPLVAVRTQRSNHPAGSVSNQTV